MRDSVKYGYALDHMRKNKLVSGGTLHVSITCDKPTFQKAGRFLQELQKNSNVKLQ